MGKTSIDKTDELFVWLDANAKVVARPEDMANGTGKEVIYTIDASKEDDFVRAYYRAFATIDLMNDTEAPQENEVWEVVTAKDELPNKGSYSWRKQGYNFDGFYEEGCHGIQECLRYYAFHRAFAYWDRLPWRGYSSLHMSYVSGMGATTKYVVCIIEDATKGETK